MGDPRKGRAEGRGNKVRRTKQDRCKRWEGSLGAGERGPSDEVAEDVDGPRGLKRETVRTWTGKLRDECRGICSAKGCIGIRK